MKALHSLHFRLICPGFNPAPLERLALPQLGQVSLPSTGDFCAKISLPDDATGEMFFIFGASSLWVGVPLPFAISTPSVEISQRNLSGDTLEIEMYFDSIEFRVLFERPEKRSFSARRRDSIVYCWVDLLDLMRSRSSFASRF